MNTSPPCRGWPGHGVAHPGFHESAGARVVADCVLLACLAGLVLGFRLDARDFWADEISSLEFAQGGAAAIVSTLAARDIHPPLFSLILGLWTHLVADDRSVLTVRLLPLIFSVASVLVTYLVAREVGGRRLALLTGLLLSTSPLLLIRGVMVRPFSLVILLAMLSLLGFVRLWRWSGWVSWIGYVVATGLLLYTDYLAAISLLAAQNTLVLIRSRGLHELRPQWIAAQAAILLLVSPQLLTLRGQAGALATWASPAHLARSLLGVAVKTSYPFYAFMFGETVYPWSMLVTVPGALVFGLLYVRGLRHLARRSEHLWGAVLLTVTPVVMLVALTSTVFPGGSFAMFPGRLLFVLPVFLLTIASGLVATRRRLLRSALMAVVLGVHGYALHNCYRGEQFLNPHYVIPWRQIARDLAGAITPGDLVIATSTGLAWHKGNLPVLHYSEAPTEQSVRRTIVSAAPPRIWLQTREGGDPTGYTLRSEFRHWLEQEYVVVGQRGYVPQPQDAVEWRRLLLGQQITSFNVVVYEYRRRASAGDSGQRPAPSALLDDRDGLHLRMPEPRMASDLLLPYPRFSVGGQEGRMTAVLPVEERG